MKNLIFSLILFLLCFQLSAQEFAYRPIKSSGDLPAFLFTSSTEKYESSIDKMRTNEEGLTEEQQEQFYLETHFRIDALLQSGKVIFNDPLGQYINQVADEILKEKPGIRKNLTFFLVKSPFPNAFTTNEGIIFVNMGLLSRLETEAQLAFILCHEIAHYQAKHIIKGYARSVSLETGGGRKSALSDIEKLILKNNYSRENERIADSIGFELFCGTSYSTETLPPVFDVLKVAHRPYLFPKNPFDHIRNPYWYPDFTPPPPPPKKNKPKKKPKRKHQGEVSFITDFDTESDSTTNEEQTIETIDSVLTDDDIEIEEIEEEEEEEDSESFFSSHPSPTKRKNLLLQQLIQSNHPGEQLFIVSRDQFSFCQKQAGYELCRMFLLDAAYYDALYQAIGMLESNADDPYLNQVVMKALYGIGKYRNESQSVPIFTDYDGQPDHLKHFYKSFAKVKFSKKEYLFLAVCRAKLHMDRFPEQLSTQKYMEDLLIDFLEIFPNFATKIDTTDAFHTTFKPGFDRMFSDTLFRKVYDKATKELKRIDDFEAFSSTRKGWKKIDKYKRKTRKRGHNLNIDSLVIFAPFYYWVDARRDEHLDFLKTEKQQDKLPDFILNSAEKLDLSVTLLDAKSMNKNTSSAAFNDLVLSSEWYGDFIQHGNFRMVPSVYDEMQILSKKYETPYFANMGTVSLRRHQRQQYNAMFMGIIGYTLPWTVYMSFKRSSDNKAFFMVLDVEENHIVAYQSHNIRELIIGPMLEAYTYYYLWQIKSDR